MDETAWQDCALLYELLALARKRMSDRQRRLFAVACCARLAHLMLDSRSRAAVEAARRFADDLASADELGTAEQAASEAFMDLRDSRLSLESGIVWTRQNELLAKAAALVATSGIFYAEDAADCVRWALLAADGWRSEEAEEAAQCRILRDIVGPLPFHEAVLEPAWLAYNDGAARSLALYIEGEQAFDALPILGDALEEAGCADERVLRHCRERADHVRGCWVLDLVLRAT